jgi:cytochrome c peroxidase
MKHKQTCILVCLVAIASFFQYCSKNDQPGTDTKAATATTNGTGSPQLPLTSFNYSSIALPAYIATALASVDNTPAANPITNDGATLGRVLFYDKNLSKNNTVSCGSCHRQDLSFSDSAIKSKGFLGGNTDRHSMALLNVRFYQSGKMFWDERANTLEARFYNPFRIALKWV